MSEKTRKEHAERRKKIREDLAAAKERARTEREAVAAATPRGVFSMKARKGDAVEVRFDFRDADVVTFTDEKDPTKGVMEAVEALREMTKKVEEDDTPS